MVDSSEVAGVGFSSVVEAQVSGTVVTAVVDSSTVVPGTMLPGTVVSGPVVPGTVVSGTVVPGTVLTVVTGTQLSGVVVGATGAVGEVVGVFSTTNVCALSFGSLCSTTLRLSFDGSFGVPSGFVVGWSFLSSGMACSYTTYVSPAVSSVSVPKSTVAVPAPFSAARTSVNFTSVTGVTFVTSPASLNSTCCS